MKPKQRKTYVEKVRTNTGIKKKIELYMITVN